MKYILQYIKQAIAEQKPDRDTQLRIRLSGFDNPIIYRDICEFVSMEYKDLQVVSKIAIEKFNYFESNHADPDVLDSIRENGWLSGDKSLTYYRNLPLDQAQLIILMGTEAVDDQGGLSDIFFIDPSRIVSELRGAYHNLFGLQIKNNREKLPLDVDVIDKMFRDLFVLVPLDICKLSDIVDRWGYLETTDEFLAKFFESLPLWGLCKDEQWSLHRSSLLRSRRNVLQPNYDFITRKAFRKMSKRQYKQYLERINQYPTTENIAFTSDWDGWYKQSTTSYEQLSEALQNYVAGVDVENYRSTLQRVDFTIIDHILNLKIGVDTKPPSTKRIPLTGAPLSAMTHAVYALAGVKSDEIYDSIHILIEDVELVDAFNPQLPDPEDKQLSAFWKKVCYASGGVFEYMTSRGICIGEQDLQVQVEPANIFSPMHAFVNVKEGTVSSASANKKLNRVSFQMVRFLNDTPIEKGCTKCEWTFPSNAGWLHAFSDICTCFEEWKQQQITSFLPVFEIENYNSLMNANSEEEFLDLLDGNSLKNEINLLEYIQKKATDNTGRMWLSEFSGLGEAFIGFVKSISENGFYGDLVLQGDSKILSFIDHYEKLGQKIIHTTFASSNLEWVFNCYIHAFAIENRSKSVLQDERQEGCIIPPFHPAILQKRVDQAVFLYDGCREVLANKQDAAKLSRLCQAIDDLEEMSEIHEGLDIFPGKNNTLFGTTRAFADYCICGTAELDRALFIGGIRKKDSVYDDDFSTSSLKRLDDAARMYLDVIESYLKALPGSRFNMTITVVNPNDLQPVVAAVYNHIQTQKLYLEEHADEYTGSQRISVKLHVLVRPENRGGKNYLTYWVNSFFNEDENVDIKIYLNDWDETETLFQMLSSETDILFLQDILVLEKLDFIRDTLPAGLRMDECRFPIVFKPIPVMHDSVRRRIELTQKQFGAATVHSQVVSYAKDYDSYGYQPSTVTKVLSINHERRELILRLHEYSNWVVCVDSGMDGALLRDNSASRSYSVIGFSTGKGRQGQYNLTITARASIIEAVNSKLKKRLQQAFEWDQEKIEKASANCMEEASRLDGVSLLSAINPKDYKINEFLAYVLTSAYIRKQNVHSGVSVIVHLDSYPHWFNNTQSGEDDSKSRPDFLLVNAKVDENQQIELRAQVIECKLSSYGYSTIHKANARNQVEHGMQRLSSLFDPNSTSIKRRYWYAQLYRALSFAQITFCADDNRFDEYAKSMRSILEGNFTIQWSGCVMGYWKDLNGDTEIVTKVNDIDLEFYDIPQKMIQRLLLGDDTVEVAFVDLEEDEFPTPEMDDLEDEIDNDEDEFGDEVDDRKEILFPDNEKPINPSVTAAEPITQTIDENSRASESTEKKLVEITASQEQPALASDNSVVPSISETKASLDDVRVYIGKDRNNNKVYWEFGNPKMANRHLLITGTSGQGKTYCIQTMLKELSQDGIPAVIFDYTEGFRLDQLDPAFTKLLDNKLDQKIIYFTGVPINPFIRHEIEIAGTKCPEKIADVAQRLANIFTHVYKFGDQQFSAIYEACRAGMQQYDSEMNMVHFKEKLEESKNPASKTVLSKMQPFLDSVEFVNDPEFNWDKLIHADGKVTVIQLTNFVREIQVIITELMLWDAWHYNKKYGDKDTPFVVVLDEAQNLSHKANSPSAVILTEGRKFGWSAWFATQSLKVLDSDEIIRLQQAAYKLYFKPTDEELTSVAKIIDPTQGQAWTSSLRSLKKGQAIVAGDRNRPDGVFGHVNPVVTNIASFKERESETL